MKLLARLLEKKQHVEHTYCEPAPSMQTYGEGILLTHLAWDLIADWHDAVVCQLKQADDLAGHDVQCHLGHHGGSACRGVRQAVAH